ncbi:MAG: Mu-like prophage major head subunit gpT family protein [Alphaproteobacteria bacterium]|nr:Mu-like prophage major head subunit gpT family protein [Alphaproteobacteria bacterium]
MATHRYTIVNRKFEGTVEVEADDISDDQIGIYSPLFTEMGRSAAAHPDELVFEMLDQAFEAECYDGQPFFDTDHPVIDRKRARKCPSPTCRPAPACPGT